MEQAIPRTNSVLHMFLMVTCCAIWARQPVSGKWRVHSSGSDLRNTRSHGTRTSSNTTIVSISSKREPRGWSIWDSLYTSDSRQINFIPGVPQGIVNAKANELVSDAALSTVDGNTMISSASAPSVARIRAPRTTMPSAFSSTMRSATSVLGWPLAVNARFDCGLTSVWVMHRSFSRAYS